MNSGFEVFGFWWIKIYTIENTRVLRKENLYSEGDDRNYFSTENLPNFFTLLSTKNTQNDKWNFHWKNIIVRITVKNRVSHFLIQLSHPIFHLNVSSFFKIFFFCVGVRYWSSGINIERDKTKTGKSWTIGKCVKCNRKKAKSFNEIILEAEWLAEVFKNRVGLSVNSGKKSAMKSETSCGGLTNANRKWQCSCLSESESRFFHHVSFKKNRNKGKGFYFEKVCLNLIS